ncbi:MAG TPA: zinc ABC transporter substrate-binding protein [Thermoplasmata archaeon]|nr:zinc ABC transporter substrate-binding protein [Thermoplasmata archaeon]
MAGTNPSGALTDSSAPNGPPATPAGAGSPRDGTARRARRKSLSALQVIGIAAVVIVLIGSATAYELVTSKSPGNPCAVFTPQQLGANATPGQVEGDTTPNYANATTLTNGPLATVPVGTTIQVVAGENFWGSLVSQLGGNLTHVLSIVSNPNADPHDYEANASDAAAIADANFVILNGVGYDDWGTQLIGASDTPGQEVLNVGVLNGVSVTGGIVTGNPHMWYNPLYVNHTLLAMYSDLVALQPASTSIFQQNFANLNSSSGGAAEGVSIDQLYSRANQIKADFAGTVVVSTESIFVYLANYTGLDLISPPAFMEAIAEGNDPPASSVAQFECQLEGGYVKVLVYNIQTVTPITSTLEGLAGENNVTVTYVSETIQPPDTSFQVWMFGQYDSLANALNAGALGGTAP